MQIIFNATQLLKSFVTGGLICVVGQILIDKTKMTPGRILTAFVVLGVILGALNLYKPLVDFAGAGATVPLPGFGYALAEGVRREVEQNGLFGAFTGGLKATAGGVTCAMLFALASAAVFEPNSK